MHGRQSRVEFAAALVAAVLCVCACVLHGAEADATAKALLEAAGVKGGLVVHVGCTDGALTAALRVDERCLVHGLAADRKALDAARAAIREQGLYGPVSADLLHGDRLPYADNLVNFLMLSNAECRVPNAELERVLAPRGVVMVRGNPQLEPPELKRAEDKMSGVLMGWRKYVKPVPSAIDDWTHYLHSANNNAVARDTVAGPPSHYQWISEPRWMRSHDHLNSLSALVSAGGRIFYIVDESPALSVALPPTWRLVARDAFSGVLLWKRPITSWEGHLRNFRTGPSELARRLVATGDRVFVTLGYGERVSVLDAASGETLRTGTGTENALEIVVANGRLFVVAGDRAPDNTDGAAQPKRPEKQWMHWPIHRETPPEKRLVVLSAETGKTLWKRDTPGLMPTALAVAAGRVYLQDAEHVTAVDAKSGKEAWRAPRKVNTRRPTWSGTTLVVQDGVVLSADRAVDAVHPGTDPENETRQWVVNSHGGLAPPGEIVAFDAATGKQLWKAPCKEVYNAPVDVLVVNGLVWSGNMVRKNEPGITQALDLKTGAVAKTRPGDQKFFNIVMGHHRCYRNKATTEYLVLGRDGIEFIDVDSGKGYGHGWVRGSCQYGVMPANGLVYAPPHSCACHIETKINSFNALAPARAPQSGTVSASKSGRLEKGVVYGKVQVSALGPQLSRDWPTYRGNAARAGLAAMAVPASLEVAWRVKPGGALSTVVAAGGACVVASEDQHALHAIALEDGKRLWDFTAGGRIDSPPTLHEGSALFGCADGWIYSVRAADGQLAWRFRAAPRERLIVAYGRVESPWPVHGSVLVHDGVLYAVAGRCAYLDGGLRLYRLNASTGELLSETPIKEGLLPDVPALHKGSVYVRHRRFSVKGEAQQGAEPHLYSPAGFLDGTWWHRTYWQYGTAMRSNYGGWPISGSRTPAGRLMVMDDKTLYGFGRFNQYNKIGGHVGLGQLGYKLYAASKQAPAASGKKGKRKAPAANRVPALWEREIPLLARGMVLAGDILFVAGPPNVLARAEKASGHPYLPAPAKALQAQAAALDGKRGALLWAISAADGKRLSELKLDAVPVWDGMAAANGRLLLALQDGSLCCLEGK